MTKIPFKTIELILISGLSGAGKSTAANALEDAGYCCIDNLPVFLLQSFLSDASKQVDRSKIALVMDARDSTFLHNNQEALDTLQSTSHSLTILYLEAEKEVLLRRYSEMRRKHPFASSVRKGIEVEKEHFATLKSKADHVIDTSSMTPHMLRAEVLKKCGQASTQSLQVNVLSFGFKNGPPVEADILFDVRFLPNPYFVPELKEHTGLELPVSSYVLDSDTSKKFLKKLVPLLQFLIPQYKKEGKAYLTIGVGCTGGRHRSVAIAEKLKQILQDSGESVSIGHRDLGN